MNTYKIECHSVYSCDEVIEHDFRHNRTYTIECNSGHKTNVIIQTPLFEQLIDQGMLSFVDKDFRTAVFKFNLALEKFREFFIKFMLIKKNFSFENIKLMWKTMKQQSERQIGAYSLLYFQEFLESIDSKLLNINLGRRNKVIHKGECLGENETKIFCEYAFNGIVDVVSRLLGEDFLPILSNIILLESNEKIMKSKIPSRTIMLPGLQKLYSSENYCFDEHLNYMGTEGRRAYDKDYFT